MIKCSKLKWKASGFTASFEHFMASFYGLNTTVYSIRVRDVHMQAFSQKLKVGRPRSIFLVNFLKD